MIREPIAKGQFYPSDPESLDSLIEELRPKEKGKIDSPGIILPHAGYIFSGKVALTTINQILPKKTVVLLGTNHRGRGENFSIWPKGAWIIPYGKIEVNENLSSRILDNGNVIKEDYSSHMYEHSLEVELPLLRYCLGNFQIVPICCSLSSLTDYREAALQITRSLKDEAGNVLFVASTDLSHYESEGVARRKDRSAINSIIEMDEEKLIRIVKDSNISMCGLAPVSVFLLCMKNLGFNKARVSLYQTSGEATGDYEAVVGYVGIVVN
ncbi:MAG: AmmeMemoRadiSam system protein B [Candidatus Omnitrophica bacterium]|nr:AmmeMemoRadiSam system protein B [Candidatus Omnitrophota bacterium]MBD3269655.1 AmmeMemoRadiSam system protein B [Candidatus Omnitrophota bacterium]